MSGSARIDPSLVSRLNEDASAPLARDVDVLGEQLDRIEVDIRSIVDRAMAFRIAVPSWGVGTGGTRFARFPGRGEPGTVQEKLQDCAVVQQLTRITPTVSLHIPWDRPDDPIALRALAAELGLGFDAMNSNTFQDTPGQRHSYKFGSLAHTDPAVRRQAIEHNLECIAIGRALGSSALTVWIADGGNFPGQQHFRHALERYLASLGAIYAHLPADWRLYLEYKLFEPAFYSTVNNDWGTSYWCATRLGEQASCLVDLGHHAPGVNIEMIVARLLQFGKLGGFHFNDCKYADDDLDAGSLAPFRLFLIFNELIDAFDDGLAGPTPVYMLDQSHNVTDPIESLLVSAMEVQRAYVRALLVDRVALRTHQAANDAVMALATLKRAFNRDVEPILATARRRAGGAVDPVATFRASGYRARVARERAAGAGGPGGTA